MKKFAASSLTRHTGDLFEAAAIAPVAITKHRKVRFVVMSVEQFENLAKDSPTQVSLDVADVTDKVGELLDEGIEETLNGR